MSKQVKMTDQLSATIRRAVGDPDLDTSQLVVYEARFLSTEAVRKPGSLYDGARIAASVLGEMAEFMSKEANAIPLHIMHETRLLPAGKVFSAQTMQMANGETELRGQFYLDKEDKENVRKLETAIVDEVSVGLATNHLYCSECNFDYMGPDADMMNALTCTCDEGHTVGEKGVHVRGVGMANWGELSLCGTGAAKKAKILGQSRQRLSKDVVDRLAANKNWEAGFFQLTCKLNEGENQMSAEFAALTGRYEAVVGEKAQVDAKLTAADAKIVTLEAAATEAQAALTAANEKITALEAAAAQSTDEAKAEGVKAKEQLDAAFALLLPHAKAALVAANVAEADLPTDLPGLMASVEKAGLKLHQVFGAGSKSTNEKTDVETDGSDSRKASFKLNV